MFSLLPALFAAEPEPGADGGGTPAAPAAEPAPAPEAAPPAEVPPAEAAPPEAPPVGLPAPTVGPRLPQLLAEAPAAYPEAALAAGREASLLLELDVDAEGVVFAARVVEPAGEGFDEAAVEAARSFRFSPALDEAGRPAPARIHYRYRFSLAQAAARSIEGVVVHADSGLGFPNLELRLQDEGGTTAIVRTDDEGRFVVSGLAPGRWQLLAAAPGHLPEALGVEVRAGVVAQARVALAAEVQENQGATVVIEARRASPSITERVLGQEEVRFLPGTGGDVVKVVQNLPGVARAPLGIGQLVIRGTAPEDSAYFLDGAPIPLVFHFSGLSTILNGDLVAEVAYLPGNYSVRHGRALGGLVDLRSKEDLPEKSRGYVALDLLQGTAYLEQKIGADTAIEASLRRSWIDAVLTPVLSGSGLDIRAPQYWDGQARLLHRTRGDGRLDALLLFSDDRFSVIGDADEGVAIGLSTSFGKARVRWLQPLDARWSSELSIIGGPEDQSFAFDGDPEAAYERSWSFGLRQELDRSPADGELLSWRIGVDLGAGRDEFEYDVASFSPYEADQSWYLAPAAYVEPTLRLLPVLLSPGLRVDGLVHDFGYARASLDPRLAGKLLLGSGSAIKASVGRFSQFPTTRQLAPGGDGNPDLAEAWSLQTSLGLEQQLPFFLSLELGAFYNRLYDLVVGREDRFRFFTGPPPTGPFDTGAYANAGTGRVCGAELLLRLDAPRTLGLLSATFSNSTRTGRDGEESLFSYDQPYVINALVSQVLPRGWRVGARFRLSTGDAYTPVVNRVYDMGSRAFIPIYGEADGARLPPFYALDLRVDKEWKFRRWALTAYLDLQNATNAQNPEVMAWTWDYREEAPITGLPILPAFGLRGDF